MALLLSLWEFSCSGNLKKESNSEFIINIPCRYLLQSNLSRYPIVNIDYLSLREHLSLIIPELSSGSFTISRFRSNAMVASVSAQFQRSFSAMNLLGAQKASDCFTNLNTVIAPLFEHVMLNQ